MKEAQTRDVRVSSKGQGGWEKENARGGCALQKDLLEEFLGHFRGFKSFPRAPGIMIPGIGAVS